MNVVILQIQMYRHYCHAITLGGYKYRRRKKDTQKRKEKETGIPSVK